MKLSFLLYEPVTGLGDEQHFFGARKTHALAKQKERFASAVHSPGNYVMKE